MSNYKDFYKDIVESTSDESNPKEYTSTKIGFNDETSAGSPPRNSYEEIPGKTIPDLVYPFLNKIQKTTHINLIITLLIAILIYIVSITTKFIIDLKTFGLATLVIFVSSLIIPIGNFVVTLINNFSKKKKNIK